MRNWQHKVAIILATLCLCPAFSFSQDTPVSGVQITKQNCDANWKKFSNGGALGNETSVSVCSCNIEFGPQNNYTHSLCSAVAVPPEMVCKDKPTMSEAAKAWYQPFLDHCAPLESYYDALASIGYNYSQFFDDYSDENDAKLAILYLEKYENSSAPQKWDFAITRRLFQLYRHFNQNQKAEAFLTLTFPLRLSPVSE